MELHILDPDFKPDTPIDQYSSMIWTERFNDVGEVELEFPLGVGVRAQLPLDTWLGLDESDRVMRVDTIEIDRNDNGVEMLKVKGKECTDILRFRTAWKGGGELGEKPKWSSGAYSAASVMHYALRQAVYPVASGTWPNLNSQDPIPNLVLESIDTSTGTIPLTTDPANIVKTEPTLSLDYIREIAVPNHLGFKFYLKKYDGMIYAQVYPGRDRTLDQTQNEPVVFATSLDNIKSLNLIQSKRDYVQGVRTYTENGYRGVSREGDTERSGFNKRVQFNLPSEPGDMTSTEMTDWLIAQNWAFLANTDIQVMLDGQITETSGYVYKEDYDLGDVVEIKTDWGIGSQCRIMEQIFTDDENGPQAYPTFVTETVVTPGSWVAAGTQTWAVPVPNDTWSER